LEARELDEKIDIEKRKKLSLAGKLKTQFDQVKISDLNTPDKLENHVTEKFKRDKSGITKLMADLDEEISKHFLTLLKIFILILKLCITNLLT